MRNLDLLPDGVRAAMEESWARGLFEARELEIFHVRGAYLVEECLIFDDQLRVIENASDPYTDEEIGAALTSILQMLQAQRLPHYAGPGVVSKRRAVNNFGHFLMEMLPMAVLGRAACPGKQPIFILHRVGPPLLDVMLRAFRVLEVTPDRLLMPDYQEPMHFEELVVVRGLTTHGTYMSPLCVQAVAGLAAKISPNDHKRLFVRRVPGWQRGRVLLNEAELFSRLEPLGFRAIEPGVMSLEQQIAAFSGADHVVAVAGAALTNIAFCRPGTQVVNIAPAYFPDTFFWFIATHRGLHYSEIRGTPASEAACDQTPEFRISEADIRWLESMHQNARAPSPAAVLAHIQHVGDTRCSLGEWVGTPSSGRWIEGFSIDAAPDGGRIRYRAVLDRDWLSPWLSEGEFCGSRGMGLPLHGLSVQLEGELAGSHELLCNATFLDGTRKENVPAGEPCMAESLAPLEAFQLVLSRRNPA